MDIGTKIEMDNGTLGIQQGVVTDVDEVVWDEEDMAKEEVTDDTYEQFGIRVLPTDWEFEYINDDGTPKT